MSIRLQTAQTIPPAFGWTLIAFLLLSCVGCAPRKTLRHAGAVTMGGGLEVNGKLDVGELSELATAIRIRDDRSMPLTPVRVSGDAHRSPKIAVIDVDDFLVDRNVGSGLGSSGENPVALFREKIQHIRQDQAVKAVIVRINSPGGGVTASDIMCHDLVALKEDRSIPIVASITVVGTGGAYYLANHCDAIIAHPTSIIGGVGVILNAYNMVDTMGQFNIVGASIKSGEKIDAGTPERELEEDEREMLQRIADVFHERFISQVTQRRPGLADRKGEWADGRIMTGEEALAVGLVDGVGYVDAAIQMVRKLAKLEPNDQVVLYRRDGQAAYTALDRAPAAATPASLLPFHLPGLDRSTMPTFLYMWQADPAMASLAHP